MLYIVKAGDCTFPSDQGVFFFKESGVWLADQILGTVGRSTYKFIRVNLIIFVFYFIPTFASSVLYFEMSNIVLKGSIRFLS